MAKSGESKQGLIITLVLFILLSLILGLTTYFGFDGQKALETQAKEARADKDKWQKTADWYQYQALLYRVYMGKPLVEENETLALRRAAYASGKPGGEVLDKRVDETGNFIKTELDAKYGWDDAKKAPVRTIADTIAALTKERDAAKAAADGANAQLAKANDDIANLNKEAQAAAEKYKTELARQGKDFQAQQAKYNEDLKKYQEDVSTKQKEADDAKRNADEVVRTVQKTNKNLEKQVKVADQARHKVEEQLPKANRLALDQPKGNIQTIGSNKAVYINLGAADHVKPNLTFRVVGQGGDGKPNGREKGTIEVVRILGDHQAQARVTDVVDPDDPERKDPMAVNRDPMVRGDFLFNPAWSPSMRQHIAIGGVIDVTGEGKDNQDEFLRSVENMDVVVDARLTLKDQAMTGEITRNTDYLVLGPLPEQVGIRLPKDKAADYAKKVDDMRKAAQQNGVKVLSLREFLAVTGYKTPRTLGENSSYDFGGKPVSGPMPIEGGSPGDKKPEDKPGK